MKNRPLSYNFLTTYQYVSAFDLWAKTEWKSYSQRSFAKWAHVASPNFISLVIARKRQLSGAWLEGFISAAKLPAEEAKYLRLLSQFESARNRAEQNSTLEQIQKLFVSSQVESLAHDQLELLSNPAAWVVYHMLDLEDQERSLVWFKNRLRFHKWVAPEIQSSLALLERLHVIEGTNKGYKSKKKFFESSDQIRKGANVLYHENILKEAGLALEALEPSERAFGSLTATVPRDKIEKLKEEINLFGQQLLKKYASTEPVDGEVMRVNIQLYPLTKKENSEQ